jgi:uncharacterized protein YjiS (DUF1127 family)
VGAAPEVDDKGRKDAESRRENTMSAQYSAVPVAGATLVRAFASLLAMVAHWLKAFARARRHRRDAIALAGLDRRMLADIGISRSDIRDAFSEPFWEDPTALLHERALERRWSRALMREEAEQGFRRPATNRPARQTI